MSNSLPFRPICDDDALEVATAGGRTTRRPGGAASLPQDIRHRAELLTPTTRPSCWRSVTRTFGGGPDPVSAPAPSRSDAAYVRRCGIDGPSCWNGSRTVALGLIGKGAADDTRRTTERWQEVTTAEPCPICEHGRLVPTIPGRQPDSLQAGSQRGQADEAIQGRIRSLYARPAG